MGLGIDSLSQKTNEWYEFNPASNTWTRKADLPGPGRNGAPSFVINGKGYVVTGQSGSGNLNDIWEYNPVNDLWTQKASFPGSPRQNAVAFSIGAKGYVGTGYHSSAAFQDFYEYDPSTDSWTRKADLPGGPRSTAVGFSAGNKGYIGLGASAQSIINYNDLYEYNPLNDTWTRKSDFPLIAIDASTTISTSSDAYVLCGYYYQYQNIEHNPMNTCFKYSPSSDSWILIGTFPGIPRGYAGGFAISNDIYLGGGGNNSFVISNATLLRDFWKLPNGITMRTASPNFEDIEVYPNPTSDFIRVRGSIKNLSFESYRIFDRSGKLILENTLSKNTNLISVDQIADGMYFIELISDKGEVYDGSFIKN